MNKIKITKIVDCCIILLFIFSLILYSRLYYLKYILGETINYYVFAFTGLSMWITFIVMIIMILARTIFSWKSDIKLIKTNAQYLSSAITFFLILIFSVILNILGINSIPGWFNYQFSGYVIGSWIIGAPALYLIPLIFLVTAIIRGIAVKRKVSFIPTILLATIITWFAAPAHVVLFPGAVALIFTIASPFWAARENRALIGKNQ